MFTIVTLYVDSFTIASTYKRLFQQQFWDWTEKLVLNEIKLWLVVVIPASDLHLWRPLPCAEPWPFLEKSQGSLQNLDPSQEKFKTLP